MANWLKVQMNALEFYQGCPQLLVPDNTKTGVTRACIYEPDLNPTYQEFAMHYRVGVMPARPRKPRDNAYPSHCTSFEHSGMTAIGRRRIASFRPCAFLGASVPGGSYRCSALSV